MKYEKPEFEVINLETQDVVCTSDLDWETPQEPW